MRSSLCSQHSATLYWHNLSGRGVYTFKDTRILVSGCGEFVMETPTVAGVPEPARAAGSVRVREPAEAALTGVVLRAGRAQEHGE